MTEFTFADFTPKGIGCRDYRTDRVETMRQVGGLPASLAFYCRVSLSQHSYTYDKNTRQSVAGMGGQPSFWYH